MSNVLLDLMSESLLRKPESLRLRAKTERYTTREPAPFALSGIFVSSGNSREVHGYRDLSVYEIQVVTTLFQTAATGVARNILQAHPEITDEVREHEYIRTHLSIGPLKRLSREEQALKALRSLLLDSRFFLEYQSRDLLDWDNGDAQGAMAIIYAWRRAITHKRLLAQSVEEIHQDSRRVLKLAQRVCPDNATLFLIEFCMRIAWDAQTKAEQKELLTIMNGFPELSDVEVAMANRMIRLAAIANLSLKYRESDRAIQAYAKLQQILVPNEPEHPAIALGRAWAQARGGNPQVARELAMMVARSSDPALRSDATQLLTQMSAGFAP